MIGLKKMLMLLFTLNLAFSISMQLIQSLFPLYLRNLDASEFEIGLVISLGNISSMAMMIPGGIMVEKVGKKRMLLTSIIFSAVPPVFISQMLDWRLVIPFFMAFNISMAFFAPARMALIAESTDQRSRASLFGVMNLAWPIGGIISPIFSGYTIEKLGWRQVFFTSAAVSALSLIPGLMLDIEDTSSTDRVHDSGRSSLLDRRYLPMMIKFFIFNFFQSIGMGGILMIIPLFLKDIFELSPYLIGLFFTSSSALALVTQTPSGYLADKFGRKKLLYIATVPIPLLYYLWMFIDDWITLLVLSTLAFGLWSMTWPAILALLSESVPPDTRGTAYGVMMTAERLAFTIGPLIAGYLYSSVSPHHPFLIASASFLLSLLPAFLLKEKPEPSDAYSNYAHEITY